MDTKNTTAQPAAEMAFIGTYTKKEGHVDGRGIGIGIYESGPQASDWKLRGQFGDIINPSFICLSPNLPLIYSVTEVGGDVPGRKSMVKVLQYDPTDYSIKEIQAIDALGTGPCYISVDRKGAFVFVANYGSGNVVQYNVNSDGTLSPGMSAQNEGHGPNASRQDGPHAHYIKQHPTRDHVYAVNLGNDQVTEYLPTKEGLQKTSLIQVAPGGGCRHLTWHPNGQLVYVLNELNGTIECWEWHDEIKERRQTLALVAEGKAGYPGAGAIDISGDGQFLYASLRGDFHEIVVVKLDPANQGMLVHQRVSAGGSQARDIALSPKNDYLAVGLQDDSKLMLFARDATTGKLTETPEAVAMQTPVCIVWK